METPDKIFVSSDPFGFMHGYDMEHHPLHGEEYICKNALMKWIQEVRTIPHENAITRDLVFQEIVNKLNSM